MQINYKKLFLSIGLILLVLLTGYLIYFIFIKGPARQPIKNTNEIAANINGLPVAPTNVNRVLINGRLITNTGFVPAANINTNASAIANGGWTATTEVVSDPILSAAMSPDGKSLVYYDRSKNTFYRLTADGKIIPISDKIFYGVEKVTWAPDTNKTILEFPDGSNIYYNLQTKEQATLPKHWEQFTFAPASDKVAFKSMGLNSENNWLAVADPDGNGARKVQALGDKENKVIADWSPAQTIVASYSENISLERQKLYFIGLNEENFKATVIEGMDLESKWSKTGDKLLYSVHSADTNYIPTLWIVDAYGNEIGANRANLGLNTWANKCAFADNSTIYCAVPDSLAKGSGFYPSMANGMSDSFYKINLVNGVKSLIAVTDGVYTARNLMVTSDGQYLYFIDNNTGALEKIRLK